VKKEEAKIKIDWGFERTYKEDFSFPNRSVRIIEWLGERKEREEVCQNNNSIKK
jgi:hypothetical protein